MNQPNNSKQASTGGPLSVDTAPEAAVSARRSYLKEAPARTQPSGRSQAPAPAPARPGKARRRQQDAGSDPSPALEATDNPRQIDLGVSHEYSHYHRGGLSTYPAPMAFADGLLALLAAALAYAAFAALALSLLGRRGLIPLQEALQNQQPILALFIALCLVGALLMILSALRPGDDFRSGDNNGPEPTPLRAFAAMACWLLAGGLALFGALRSGLPLAGPYPSSSSLGIWLALGCLGLILVSLARLLLARHARQQSEILSTADPGFPRQLSELSRQRNLIFAGIVVFLLLAYALSAYLLFRGGVSW